MVDLELYRIFKVVAEEENITNASKKLNVECCIFNVESIKYGSLREQASYA